MLNNLMLVGIVELRKLYITQIAAYCTCTDVQMYSQHVVISPSTIYVQVHKTYNIAQSCEIVFNIYTNIHCTAHTEAVYTYLPFNCNYALAHNFLSDCLRNFYDIFSISQLNGMNVGCDIREGVCGMSAIGFGVVSMYSSSTYSFFFFFCVCILLLLYYFVCPPIARRRCWHAWHCIFHNIRIYLHIAHCESFFFCFFGVDKITKEKLRSK